MKIVIQRDFISSQYGNLSSGEVKEVEDHHGKHFIEHGLAKEFVAAKPAPAPVTPPVFHQPTKEETPGSASQAAPASQPKTAKKSESGGQKKKGGKSR